MPSPFASPSQVQPSAEQFLSQQEEFVPPAEPLESLNTLPSAEIDKRAFLSASLENDQENFQTNYSDAKFEMETSGQSALYDKHLKTWQAEQIPQVEEQINNILLDDTIPHAQKLTILQKFKNDEYISNNIEDKYIRNQASREDLQTTQADIDAQTKMSGIINNTLDKHREIDAVKRAAFEGLDANIPSLLLGIARDIAPGVWTAENVITAEKLSDKLAPGHMEHLRHIFQTVALPGNAKQEIAQHLDSILDPEQKLEFTKTLIEIAKENPIPGTDYNTWMMLEDFLNRGEQSDTERWIENVIGWLDVHSLGKAAISPIRFLQGLTSFKLKDAQEDKLYKFLGGLFGIKNETPKTVGQKVDPSVFQQAKVEQDARASNPPTGTALDPDETGKLVGPPAPKPKSNPVEAPINPVYKVSPKDQQHIDSIQKDIDTLKRSEVEHPEHFRQNKERILQTIAEKEKHIESIKASSGNKKKQQLENMGLPEDVVAASTGTSKAKSDDIATLERNIANLEKIKAEKPESFGKMHERSLASQKKRLEELKSQPQRPKEVVPEINSPLELTTNPSIPPISPIGNTAAVNPTAARDMGMQGILDESYARQAGTEPGEIIGSFTLEKFDDPLLKTNPDMAEDIAKWDRQFNDLFDETKQDPYLVDVDLRNQDKEKIYRTFRETQGAYYQAANSSLRESLGAVEGVARYGRNADYAFSSMEEAIAAEKHISDNFADNDLFKFETKITEDATGFYVDMNWSKQYDAFSSREFGIDSADASFLGHNVGGLSRGSAAKYIFPPTTRLPEWVTKGGFTVSISAARVGEQFARMQKAIRDTKLTKELDRLTNHILEKQEYATSADIASWFPHLSEKQRNELLGKQFMWRRFSEYMWNWSNRSELARKEAEGMRGLWGADGKLLGYGRPTDQIPSSATRIWDFNLDAAVVRSDLSEGYQFVKLEEPVTRGFEKYEYGIIGGRSSVGMLPSEVVPKLKGYIPRINVESWYVKAHPKSLKINGNTLSDVDELRANHTNTLGAAKDAADAKLLAEKMQRELGDDWVVSHVRERTDKGDAILTDFKVYKERIDYGKKRGDRLPTIDGYSRLEDPFVAAHKRSQSLARLDAWRQYDIVFQKNFVKNFKAFLSDGTFPSTIHGLHLPDNATEDIVQGFQVAQRLYEQYTNSKYRINQSDIVWKTVGHKIADTIDGIGMKIPSDKIRDIANSGDQFRKGLKSLGNNLFLNLNPLGQWVVQPAIIMEFAMIERGFRNQMHMLPALMVNILSRASEGKPYQGAFKWVADTISLENPKEFNAIADAIYKAGIPQGVDLNMMLHGGLDALADPLVQGVGATAINKVQQVVKAPGQIGKTIGYTPAQLLADMSGFLFAKARWEKLNPGKNWNTPTHIRQIAADGWDIMGSMATRAGAMPYQDGYLGLLFQFEAILAKNFFQIFSSKSLRRAEGEIVDPKVKLAAARMALYGIYGVPAGTLVYNLWKEFFGDETNPETIALHQKYQGGLVDLVTNTTIDLMLKDPEDKSMDLAVSKRVGPMPETLPYVDLFYDMFKFATGQKVNNPRFPFVNAVGSVYDAVGDMGNLFKVKEYNTVDSLKMMIPELAEMATGYNNYARASMINELSDKKNRFGQELGLELSFNHVVAQMFGITSQREQDIYKSIENKKEREEFIEKRATELFDGMLKLKDKIGTPDFEEYVRRANILNAGTSEADREEIMNRFIQKDKQQWLTQRESIAKYLMDHYRGQNDKWLNQMIATFKNGGEKEQEMYKLLLREGLIPNE